MPHTDISEKGLESLMMLQMTGTDGLASVAERMAAETPDAISAAKAGGSGWLAGNPKNYDRTHALDVPQLFDFLQATQPEMFKKLGIADYKDAKRHLAPQVPRPALKRNRQTRRH
jgi:type I restriction enzyme R subunit